MLAAVSEGKIEQIRALSERQHRFSSTQPQTA
jgi:hypothetical protein